jgi:hypothetical protein
MPPVYEDKLVLVTHHFKHDSLAREAVITFAAIDVDPPATAQDFANAFHTLAGNSFGPQLDSNVQLMRTTTIKGNGSTVFTVGTSVGDARRGSKVESMLPSNTAALVQKRTALGGRSGRGRVYLPWFLIEGVTDEIGNLGQSNKDNLQVSADAYFAGYEGNMVLAKRTYDLPWDNPARQLILVSSGPLVTALVVSGIAATQRRRMPRS